MNLPPAPPLALSARLTCFVQVLAAPAPRLRHLTLRVKPSVAFTFPTPELGVPGSVTVTFSVQLVFVHFLLPTRSRGAVLSLAGGGGGGG